MLDLDIRIVGVGDRPPFPDLIDSPEVHLDAAVVLEAGMASGKPSVALVLTLPDGSKAIAQTSLAIIDGLAATGRGAAQRWEEQHEPDHRS